MITKKELAAQIENRLQFLTTISVFFPTVLYAFFKAVGEVDQSSNRISLNAASLILICLLSYVVFLWAEKYFTERQLWRLGVLIGVAIFSFIIPTAFAIYAGATMPIWLGYILQAALWFQAIMIFIVFAFIVFYGINGWNQSKNVS